MGSRPRYYDDLDESETSDVAERRFALGDNERVIDLTEANWERLQEALAPFMAASREAPKKRKRGPNKKSGTPATPSDSANIRKWAAENGMEVNARGAIPLAVKDAYKNRNK